MLTEAGANPQEWQNWPMRLRQRDGRWTVKSTKAKGASEAQGAFSGRACLRPAERVEEPVCPHDRNCPRDHKIGMTNLAYNMQRSAWLDRRGAPARCRKG